MWVKQAPPGSAPGCPVLLPLVPGAEEAPAEEGECVNNAGRQQIQGLCNSESAATQRVGGGGGGLVALLRAFLRPTHTQQTLQ